MIEHMKEPTSAKETAAMKVAMGLSSEGIEFIFQNT